MGQKLRGAVVLVTGAARGQGAAEARLFVEEGARVMIADVLDPEGERLAEELRGDAVFHHLDVGDEQQWADAVRRCEKDLGGLHVLVNNAGVVRFGPLASCSLEEYMEVVRVNQVGVFLGMRAATPLMTTAGRGSIINVSSIEGLSGMAGLGAYGATKFAVRGMTKVAALELAASGIRVNSIHPGAIDTPMLRGAVDAAELPSAMFAQVPLKRAGLSEEVAQLALFLASDDSSYCTGSEFVIDGGWLAGHAPIGG